MSVYLDASLLVSAFAQDTFSDRADAYLRQVSQTLVVSDLAAAEFSSVMARRVRTGDQSKEDAHMAFANFDAWTARVAQRVETTTSDVQAATIFIRRLDLTLRTPDALHIALARRTATALATFDEKTATSASALGLEVEPA